MALIPPPPPLRPDPGFARLARGGVQGGGGGGRSVRGGEGRTRPCVEGRVEEAPTAPADRPADPQGPSRARRPKATSTPFTATDVTRAEAATTPLSCKIAGPARRRP